jgi:hypothetical protein
MRTSKLQRKPGVRRPEVRSIKIQPKYRVNVKFNKRVPEIRFSGNWLERLGFEEGKRVSVTIMEGLLIVRLEAHDIVDQR